MGKVIKVREVGDPVLEKVCDEVDINNINKDVLDTIEDLKATLEFGTGLGIAAPQIAVNKRIIVVGAKKENINYNDAEEIPLTAMINPTWKKLSEETDIQYEGCMSVPVIRGKVERYKHIELTYYNEKGEKIIKQIHGFFARLVQHECDHLDGIVFLEKVKGPNGFATVENIKKYNLRGRKEKNMELFCKVTDEDIGGKSVKMENPKLRHGARGIVIREDGKIAVFNKSNKNEFKLPGGGIEGKENPEEAFKREALEETGCEVEIIDTLGTIEEYKSKNNFKQISYVFVGKVIKDTKQLHVTKKEKDEGAKLLWETPEKALELVKGCYDKLVASKYASVYSTKFVVLRDRKILERYLNLK